MAFAVNKTRILQIAGLDDINITAPVIEWHRFENVGGGKVAVILNIYQNQAAFDAGEKPFEQRSYEINTHPNVDLYLKNELLLLPEFDSITDSP